MSKENSEESLEPMLEPRDQVELLLKKGKVEEAIKIIEGREPEEGLEELRWRVVESKYASNRGEFEQVIEITEEIIKELVELEAPVEHKGEPERIKIDAINEQAWAQLRLGRLEDVLETVDEGIRLIEKLVEKEELDGENKDKERKVDLFKNKGIIYWLKGEVDKAVKYCKKCLTLSKDLGNKELIAYSLNNLGMVYRDKGELGLALDKLRESLALNEEIGNKNSIASTLNNLGIIYQELGELEKALDIFKQSMVIRAEMGNNVGIAYLLFLLIVVTIDLDEIKQAKDYLRDLQLINEQEENKQVDLISRLAEALILKTSKRSKNITKAEEILEEIVEEEIIFHLLTVQALVNLSEILLDELRSTGEEEILEEVEEKVDKLFEIAKKQQSYTLLTESYRLKAQLALVRLDLKEARSLLTQAQEMAEDKGLERLARKISSAHDQLLNQLDQWEELIAKDASITERVKVANLEELVGWMARKREIKVEEKEDEPVMLLLVSNGGVPLYSKKFDQTKKLQDILISGFLTSINSFVREAFEVKGMIRRITHDEYTLSFNLVDPILFCYVYEGQSYTAMKKLDKLITEVHESEVWSALEEVGKTGYELNYREKEQMEGVIGEIFVTN